MQRNMSGLNYPTEVSENWKHRASLLSHADKDPQFAAALKILCHDNVLFWINSFCYIYEVRQELQRAHGSESAILPFITYPFQDKYILKLVEQIESEKDMLTEKTRDMGVSWMVLIVFVWFWQFGEAGNDFLLGSRKENFVDMREDMDALFPKIRFLLRNQPLFLLPKGFSLKSEADEKRYAPYMIVKNPETGSTITGEANNKYFGSGGRRRAVLLDEYAKWEHTDESAWQSLGDVTPCRLPVSSANGKKNQFYKLRAGEVSQIKVARVHWKDHPHKDNKWYEAEKTRRSPSELAAEVDINYAASVTNRAYESYKESVHVKSVKYDTDTPITLMCDFNIDPMSWAIAHEFGGECAFFEEISMFTASTARAAETFGKRFKAHENKQLNIYGDASGHARQRAIKGLPSEYTIVSDILRVQYGWQVTIYVPKGNPLVSPSIEALEKRLSDWEHQGKSWITIDPKCRALIESFEQTQRKDDGIDKSGVEHMTDGPRYWAYFKYPIISREVSYDPAW